MLKKIKSKRNNEGYEYWLNNLNDENIKNYIKYRIINKISWFETSGRRCRNVYQRLMFLSIIISSVIPIFSIFANGSILMKTIIAILGSIVTIIGSYITLHNYKERWVEYMHTKNILQNVLYMYFNRRGDFAIEDEAERNGKLVDTCEKYFMENASALQELKNKN